VKTWQKMLISMLITLVIGGAYLFSVWRHRQNPGVIPQDNTRQTLSKDDLVVMREFFPMHFEDTLRLEGTTVWMKNGYIMPYYLYSGGHVQFAKRAGLIPAAQRLDVKKIVKQIAPVGEDDSVGHGDRQAFAVLRCREALRFMPRPLGPYRATTKLITVTCCSIMMTRTRFTTTGPEMCGRPLMRIR
jgi:hypothetical protein